MNPILSKLKVGDKITHYKCGQLVDAEIVSIGKDIVYAKFEPVFHGTEQITTGYVMKSTPLQAKYYNAVTPAAWKDGKPITINGVVPNYVKIP